MCNDRMIADGPYKSPKDLVSLFTKIRYSGNGLPYIGKR